MQRRHALGVFAQVVHRRQRAPRHRAGQCIGEQLGPRPLREVVAQGGRRSGESAGCSTESLPEGGSDDVDLSEDTGVLRRATASGAQDPGRVGVVHGHYGVVLAGQLQNVRQPGDIALHREDAVGEHQSGAGVLRSLELLLQVGHVGVLVDRGAALADRTGEADGVDDRGMVELVGDHRVVRTEHCGAEAFIRVPAGHV